MSFVLLVLLGVSTSCYRASAFLFIYGLSNSRSVACEVKRQTPCEMYANSSGALTLLCSQDLNSRIIYGNTLNILRDPWYLDPSLS
jgi:hypothetical protein